MRAMSPFLGLLLLQTQVFELQKLDLTTMTCGWYRPQINRSIENKPLTLGGKTYARGIGTHANSVLNLGLNEATTFEAVVGVDDEAQDKGSVEFLVIVDGVTRWRSGKMRGGDKPKTVRVDLKGAKTLSLQATDAGDGSYFDHADWADARITTNGPAPIPMRDLRPIRIETAHANLSLYVDDEGRLFQRKFGAKNTDTQESQLAFPVSGDGWVYLPALEVVHADGNTSTDLRVVKYSTSGDSTHVELKDPQYPFFVDLYFRAYPDQDVIETWNVVRHEEKGTVVLNRFASSTVDFGKGEHWLTQFHGAWSDEANMASEKLSYGTKTIDSKLGVRAHEFRHPWFLLSNGGPVKEDEGEVIGGSLAYSGNFAFDFDVDATGSMRAICGMNPFASAYHLKAGEKFETPKMVWAWSNAGAGQLSRNLQQWVRHNVIREGDRPRSILLNNWEATYFTFDEKKLISLFEGAKSLGMELFLLDDGWFGRKYPRDDDSQGLGDWTPDPKKLPNGIKALTDAAKKIGIRFGIWLEPEMVNPRSELFEKHPDWAIQQPKRELQLQRNQLVLDLTRPEVKEYVFQVADKTLSENPGISYVKWDCNRYLTQPGSPFLGADRQSHLWIDYTRALYEVFDRLAKKHPNVEIMMCSGGGGRVDYGAMKFAHEFWPSDRTDPTKRIFIQWGYSYFFPAIATSNHVTNAGGHSLKFTFDVAMSGRLGMDMDVDKLTPDERAFVKQAIETYKGIRDVVQLGEQYRLESPYDGPRSALMYRNGKRSVAFVYSLGDSKSGPLKLKGLDAAKSYSIKEINLEVGKTGFAGKATGADLMQKGLELPALKPNSSMTLEISEN